MANYETTGAQTARGPGREESLGQEAARTGSHLVGAARSRFRSAFHDQQVRAADQLGTVAHAIHQAATDLQQRELDAAARYADSIADQIERLAGSLRDRDLDDLVADAERFARRQPELFIGGAVMLGFLFARFLKSSAQRREMGRQEVMATPYGDIETAGTETAMEPTATTPMVSGAAVTPAPAAPPIEAATETPPPPPATPPSGGPEGRPEGRRREKRS